ncbi:putative receptor-like protein kinase [Hibiscus syriacus]|uniref:2-oxoadipate dioxygenase/decarboxylase n=1 Tax=Hibiscus syriacus TaxID=106335 RepID=A0A6A3BUW7_HIBSY|nr:putative receptor-like protein kinase [Hibiscus syriacus]
MAVLFQARPFPQLSSARTKSFRWWKWCYWPLTKSFYFRASCGSTKPQSTEKSPSLLSINLAKDAIMRKYTEKYGCGNKYAALASALVSLTWEKPLYSEFQQLEGESEYAAWTFVNGYALNHVTISTHRLKSNLKNIKSLNQFIEKNGFKLNYEGGVLKGSPDGLLLQSSTVADSIPFSFSDGINESVPCSYIEFAERLVLPQYKNQPESEIKESHRRDGFEVGNADKIFESISKEQLTRRA